MQTSVSPLRIRVARSIPILTPRCTCGQALEFELERDCGTCVDCLAEAAGASNGGMA